MKRGLNKRKASPPPSAAVKPTDNDLLYVLNRLISQKSFTAVIRSGEAY
jgi:hypothetical protein